MVREAYITPLFGTTAFLEPIKAPILYSNSLLFHTLSSMPYHKRCHPRSRRGARGAPAYSQAKRDRYNPVAKVPRDPISYQVTAWFNYTYTLEAGSTELLSFSLAQLPALTYAAYKAIWDEYMIDKITVRLGCDELIQTTTGETTFNTGSYTFDVVMAPCYAVSILNEAGLDGLLANNNKQHQKFIHPYSGNNTMEMTIYPRPQYATLTNDSSSATVAANRSWLGFAASQATESTHYGLLLKIRTINPIAGVFVTPSPIEIKVKFHLKLRSN